MNDISELKITHADICLALAYWLTHQVTRDVVVVSQVVASSTYNDAEFKVTFSKRDVPQSDQASTEEKQSDE